MPHCAIIVSMEIASPCVVSLTWRLADAQGIEIDELTEPVEFFFGGDDLLAKVEEALAGQSAGYETTLHLEPEHAFGEYDSELVFFEERTLFPENIEPGMQFYPDHVVLDGNHPLAGIGLRLEIVVRDVREASEAEIEAGSVGQEAVSVLAAAQPGPQLH
jgi:FKBP-type peptidyl-prolyl cis-trans isomerase SlyD